eukprot:CAMPEP_0114985862 /NCGR_PEP_ID=MMETSP0216-20121206/8113_1 /TAXON_ID=223996 /ORGANISM="Protocruzia adherens, Strain Boccale" /LENGTH=139 /DNA_ID=CAMNT_0002348247 /DNA_START=72 /DNA_END=491 /DNA_ORIENTATION=-
MAGLTEDANLTEEIWGKTEGVKNLYSISKVLAEKAAWEYVEKLPEGRKFELTTILPGLIQGPPLTKGSDFASAIFLTKVLNGEMKMQPDLLLPYVDVRDVAQAHILAFENPISSGNRYICHGGEFKFLNVYFRGGLQKS